jgi:transcriptional regulator GlxA family with amidase domain
MPEPVTIVFAAYPNFNHLDLSGPHQILSMIPGAKIIVASVEGGEISSDAGLTFSKLARLRDVSRCDVICTIGGSGLAEALRDGAFVAEVRRLGLGARFATSVCTGSLILGAAGLLKGKRAACHWAWRDLLPAFGAIVDESRIVKDGNVVTGGGVTAGIDLALALAAEIAGEKTAQAIQLGAEYAPAPPFNAGRPETAPREVVDEVRTRLEARRSDRTDAVAQAAARLAAQDFA